MLFLLEIFGSVDIEEPGLTGEHLNTRLEQRFKSKLEHRNAIITHNSWDDSQHSLKEQAFILARLLKTAVLFPCNYTKRLLFFPCCFTGASSNHQEKQMCFSKKQIRCD